MQSNLRHTAPYPPLSYLMAALAATQAGLARDKEKDVLQILDTHQHLWDLTKFRLPWHKNVKKLAKSFVMDDYLKATGELEKSGAKVVKSIYMEVDVAPEQQ